MIGFTDKPVSGKEEDIFGVGKYIQGLSGFIMDCDTPMTVAVQGDWGSGKTSFMMLIKGEIENKVLSVWFNTWQFSQFNLGDNLPIMLVSKLIDSLGVKGRKGNDIKQSLRTLGGALLHLGLSWADNVSGTDVSGMVQEVRGEEIKDITDIIAQLKEQFQECVNDALKEQKKERVVIFVDDLDRLQPAKAVELLEVLKLFLDCDHCVFVLAIDYEVVSQGVNQKYGETIDNDKGRNFFDKIIQVPFKMPVAHYDVSKYTKAALEKMQMGVSDEGPYVELIRTSIGYNPRGMKRLMNAFLLLQRIHSDEDIRQEYTKKMLFAVLCLQLSYEEIYNFIVRNSEQLEAEFYALLTKDETYQAYLNGQGDEGMEEELPPVIVALFSEWGLTDQNDIDRIISFMKSFYYALTDENEVLTKENLQLLSSILNFSAATASVSSMQTPISANGKSGLGVRYKNVLDSHFSYHKINENIVFDNKTKLPGWSNSVLEKFRLFGEEKEATKFGNMQCKVLNILYNKNPNKFMDIRRNSDEFGLSSLFNGIGDKIQAAARIRDANIDIETKTSSHTKVMDLRKVMDAMGYDPGELELYVKLAHRVS